MDFTPGIFDLLYKNLDATSEKEYPVSFTLIDSGNGFRNLRYKGAESLWQNKMMTCDTGFSDEGPVYTWTIVDNIQAGEWEWGISASDPFTGNHNLWLLNLIQSPNRKVIIHDDGTIRGETSIVIPKYSERVGQPEIEMTEYVDMNKFGTTQRVNSTLAKQLALYVVFYSPLQMASDFIENYDDQPAFQFIKDVPVDWDTTIVLNAKVGEYVTLARKDRNSDDWYVGSITNTDSRSFEISLDFLDEDRSYVAEHYADGEDADWDINPLAIEIDRQDIFPGEKYVLRLARGGGHAVRFRAQKKL